MSFNSACFELCAYVFLLVFPVSPLPPPLPRWPSVFCYSQAFFLSKWDFMVPGVSRFSTSHPCVFPCSGIGLALAPLTWRCRAPAVSRLQEHAASTGCSLFPPRRTPHGPGGPAADGRQQHLLRHRSRTGGQTEVAAPGKLLEYSRTVLKYRNSSPNLGTICTPHFRNRFQFGLTYL